MANNKKIGRVNAKRIEIEALNGDVCSSLSMRPDIKAAAFGVSVGVKSVALECVNSGAADGKSGFTFMGKDPVNIGESTDSKKAVSASDVKEYITSDNLIKILKGSGIVRVIESQTLLWVGTGGGNFHIAFNYTLPTGVEEQKYFVTLNPFTQTQSDNISATIARVDWGADTAGTILVYINYNGGAAEGIRATVNLCEIL